MSADPELKTSPPGRHQPWLIAASVLGLAFIVAIASRGNPLLDAPLGRGAGRGAAFILAAWVTALAALVGVALTYAFHRFFLAKRSPPPAPHFGQTLQRALPLGSVTIAALVLWSISTATGTNGGRSAGWGFDIFDLPGLEGFRGTITDNRTGALAGEDRRPVGTGGVGERDPLDTIVLLVFAGGAIVTLIILSRFGKKPRPAAPVELSLEEPSRFRGDRRLHDALLATIDDMIADPDPRTSILGAYARLLEALAASGVARLDHEAPLEHLRRALSSLDVRPDPLKKLTGLFELARFSTHPLTAQHRAEALAALRDTAAELAPSGGAESTASTR